MYGYVVHPMLLLLLLLLGEPLNDVRDNEIYYI